jgi:hypothetical protein
VLGYTSRAQNHQIRKERRDDIIHHDALSFFTNNFKLSSFRVSLAELLVAPWNNFTMPDDGERKGFIEPYFHL